MSQENIERARRMLEAVGREDYDAAMELVHPQIELVPPGAQAPRKGAGRSGSGWNQTRSRSR
jgi:ketosteroid isomerase-like protein